MFAGLAGFAGVHDHDHDHDHDDDDGDDDDSDDNDDDDGHGDNDDDNDDDQHINQTSKQTPPNNRTIKHQSPSVLH
jgi:hypothetical protein